MLSSQPFGRWTLSHYLILPAVWNEWQETSCLVRWGRTAQTNWDQMSSFGMGLNNVLCSVSAFKSVYNSKAASFSAESIEISKEKSLLWELWGGKLDDRHEHTKCYFQYSLPKTSPTLIS